MKFAFVFPGQGSQSVGMVKDLSESFAIVRECYQEISDAIEVDLWKMVQEGPAEDLNQTKNTQPAMLAASYSISKIWADSTERRATIMAGHSFGEVSAFTCAGAMTFHDAALLARRRGEFMQNAVAAGSGAMAAVLGLENQELDELCKSISSDGAVVEAVNYNAPGQVVVAGHTQAVEKLIDLAKQEGAKRALKLPVSVPAHSSLMRPAAEKFASALTEVDFNMPSVPVIQNATLASPQDTRELVSALQAQLHSPVRWVNTIESIKQAGASCLIEVGPGKVLTGLHKRIDKSLTSVCVCDNTSLETALNTIEEEQC
ncbi:MAG: ACP S-malonyltransferase [Gammaproteobacteria bacterium]|nr:ACP S-malonyltransferase [Gammaproteobacteria bacterium]